MSHKKRRLLTFMLVAVVLSLGALAYAITRNRKPAHPGMSPTAFALARPMQEQVSKPGATHLRNLSRQPQAFTVGRKLGKRFAADKREISVMTGTLMVGSERRSLQIARKQTTDGEQIQITFTEDSKSLTWDATNGGLSSGLRATSTDRDLIERLLLDSPDQFVLAQLRGASYYTVARNVRSEESKEGADGTLWDIVRLDDPERDEIKRPQSRWRLYYINTTTGLIDRIVSEVQGQQVVAELTWTESNGEKITGQIVWTRQGQTIMQYNLTNFSHANQEGAR